MLRVVPATTADLEAIRGLAITRSTARLLEDTIVDPGHRCLVARLDGAVVGAAIGLLQLDEAHVCDVAVATSARRQGIAVRLLAELEGRLVGLGATATTLEVRPSNVAARGLYHRLGFLEEGRRPRYYSDGEDALVLWRRPVAEVGA